MDTEQRVLWLAPEEIRPTGVIAVNNLTCIGCIKALSELGLVIGEDISLAGFDDHLLARYSRPGITVIDRPTIEMGEKGAELLTRLLRKETEVPVQTVMEVRLRRRQSVKNLREADTE